MKFHINEALIKPEFRQIPVINGLYAAIYEEFKGAIHKDKYSSMTPIEKINEINRFAEDWLKKRGFI